MTRAWVENLPIWTSKTCEESEVQLLKKRTLHLWEQNSFAVVFLFFIYIYTFDILWTNLRSSKGAGRPWKDEMVKQYLNSKRQKAKPPSPVVDVSIIWGGKGRGSPTIYLYFIWGYFCRMRNETDTILLAAIRKKMFITLKWNYFP